jgi:hypothetical protein
MTRSAFPIDTEEALLYAALTQKPTAIEEFQRRFTQRKAEGNSLSKEE